MHSSGGDILLDPRASELLVLLAQSHSKGGIACGWAAAEGAASAGAMQCPSPALGGRAHGGGRHSASASDPPKAGKERERPRAAAALALLAARSVIGTGGSPRVPSMRWRAGARACRAARGGRERRSNGRACAPPDVHRRAAKGVWYAS